MYIAINRGFTLIELLVTVSVASILLAVAAPSYRTFVQDNQLTAQSDTFFSAMMLTKSEAVTRNSPVTICPTADGTTCTGGTNWTNGWIVFADANNDDAPDATEVIRVGTKLPGQSTLTSKSTPMVTFAASGTPLGFNNDTFSLCDDRGAPYYRTLVLSAQGSLRTDKGKGGACP
jgi:type IV fimbrial biogenesis protein FimT